MRAWHNHMERVPLGTLHCREENHNVLDRERHMFFVQYLHEAVYFLLLFGSDMLSVFFLAADNPLGVIL